MNKMLQMWILFSCIVASRTLDISQELSLDDGSFDDFTANYNLEGLRRRPKIYGVAQRLLKPPTFTQPKKMLKSIIKPAGSTVVLKCKAHGNPPPNITWYKNDESNFHRDLGEIRYRKWAIQLEEVVTSDSGHYKCLVCNFVGCASFVYELDILERFPSKPYIKDGFPKNLTLLVNTKAIFECPQLIADLEPYIQWIKSKNLGGSNGSIPEGYVIEPGQYAEHPEYLEIPNVTHEHEGYYTCVAANSLGHTISSAYLHVVDAFELKEDPQSAITTYLFIIAGMLVFFALVVVLVIFEKYKREKIKKLIALETARAAVVTQWAKKVTVEKMYNKLDVFEPLLMPNVQIEKQKSRNYNSSNSMVTEYELPTDSDFEIPRELLCLGNTLGEGAFGKVVKAEGIGILTPGVNSVVAVKMLKEGHTDNEMMDIVSEMEMMKMIGKHMNIINLLGCCTQNGPLYVIVEYAPGGNLRDFLRKHRACHDYESAFGIKDTKILTQKDLVLFAHQIAKGMEFLSSSRCIHRDLAARNVLVSDDYILKIADFGLDRDIHCSDNIRKTAPIKWMAPEALFRRFYTTHSDVRSYGILLWEIMTLGGTPYLSFPSVEKLFQLLRSGHRMEKPPCCSLEIYVLMRECWSYNPNESLTFLEIVNDLDRILAITNNEEYLDPGLPQLDTLSSSESSCDKIFPD